MTSTEKMIEDGLWRPIEEAPKDEAVPFLILRPYEKIYCDVVIQVSFYQGRMYPDARGACIDWEDGIENATHFRPLPDDRIANALERAVIALQEINQSGEAHEAGYQQIAKDTLADIDKIARGDNE